MEGAEMLLTLGAIVAAVGIAVALVREGDRTMTTLLSGRRGEREARR